MHETELPTQQIEIDLGDRVLKLLQLTNLTQIAVDCVISGDDPYWGYLWPAAIVLVHAIKDTNAEGKRVLDLGCGLGAAGLTAAAKGADVLLADIRPEAIALATKNAALNALKVGFLQLDFQQPPPTLGRFDVILASGVFYADGMMGGVMRFLRKHLRADGVALVTDAMRVPVSGVTGAGRLNGLETKAHVAKPGETMTGGMMLYEIRPWRRKSKKDS